MSSGRIVARASCRADLAGGTLDLWPLYLFHPGGVTVNLALTIMTECSIRPHRGQHIILRSRDTGREDRFASLSQLLRAKQAKHSLAWYLCRFFLRDARPGGGFLLETDSESPAGAGISGSSALMVATTAALARYTGLHLTKAQIRLIAQNVETQVIRVPTGCQDYYPGLYGGVGAIHLREDGIHHERLEVPLAEMNQRFLLAYTGAPRQSGINNWEVFKAHINGDRRVFKNFEDIAAIAIAMRQALLDQDWDDVARLLGEEWKLRKTNAPGITTPLIEKLVAAARQHGGRGAKVCGAGGGGCAIFFVEPEAHEQVEAVLQELGATMLPFRVASRGLTVQG
jgi:D-glycero-alpha-D-manno-heptose-7-phosphate kinase